MFSVETLHADGSGFRCFRFEHYHAAYSYAEDAKDRGLIATVYEGPYVVAELN